jgi:hypothetical protein
MATEKGQVVEEESQQRLEWCVENEWPTVDEIREEFSDEPATPVERRWRRFVQMADRVVHDYDANSNRAKVASSVLALDSAERQKWESGRRSSA